MYRGIGMNEKIDSLISEQMDIQWEIMYKLKTLIEADWDSNTLKLKLQRLVTDFDKLSEELDKLEDSK